VRARIDQHPSTSPSTSTSRPSPSILVHPRASPPEPPSSRPPGPYPTVNPQLLLTHTTAFAFIEFRREDDAEDAYYDMHGRSIDGRRITVQWAKRPPSAAWRHEE
jgi:hypothetical protein